MHWPLDLILEVSEMQSNCSICQRGRGKRDYPTRLSHKSIQRPLFMLMGDLCYLVVGMDQVIYRASPRTTRVRTSGPLKVIYLHRDMSLV